MPALAKPNHERFARAYVENGRNATNAYLAIYKGVTRVTAGANGSKLLRNTQIYARIEELTGEQLSAAETVFRLATEYAVEAVEHLMQMLRNEDTPPPVRAKCAELIMNRGVGMPTQQVSIQQRISYVLELPTVSAEFDRWITDRGKLLEVNSE